MICAYCGGVLKPKNDRCPSCGRDVRMFKRIISTSNALYNEGLKRASIRDLSGAAEVLRESLKLYKMNIPARNLLGLVYFEMGEGVNAMSEWVISKNLSAEENPAEEYLNRLQESPAQLETVNQTAKKYNQALLYCRQDSRDLAVIQLKKVLSVNPKMVRAHQLLALLYMQEGRYDLAKKSLRSAMKIDGSNLTTLRYLKECNNAMRSDTERERKKKAKENEELISYVSGNETIIQPARFRDNTALSTVINILIGAAIGVLVTWFLIVPGVRQNVRSEMNVPLEEATNTISEKEQSILSLENEISQLESQIEAAQNSSDEDAARLSSYQQLLAAYIAFAGEDIDAAGQALANVNTDYLDTAGRDAYNTINAEVNEQYMSTAYEAGMEAYRAGNFDDAKTEFQKIISVDETYHEGDALYSLAQACRRNGEDSEAVIYYKKIMSLYPDTKWSREAERYLSELGEDTTLPDAEEGTAATN